MSANNIVLPSSTIISPGYIPTFTSGLNSKSNNAIISESGVFSTLSLSNPTTYVINKSSTFLMMGV